MAQIQPPRPLDFETSNLPREWEQWKEQFSLYVSLAMEGQAEEKKLQMLKYLIGARGREIYKTVKPAVENLENALDALGKHCKPPNNETVDRYQFFTRHQEKGEGFDTYLTELRLLARRCNFGQLESSLLRDRIICGISDGDMRQRLLREPGLTYERCILACRALEFSRQNAGILDGPDEERVHSVRPKEAKYSRPKSSKEKTKSKPTKMVIRCKFCGKQHEQVKEKCPAYGKECGKCGKPNHFKAVCKSKQAEQVHELEENLEELQLNTVELVDKVNVHAMQQVKKPSKRIFARMLVEGQHVRFQLDSGATCNVLPRQAIQLDERKLQQTDSILGVYNHATMKPDGRCTLKVVNPKVNEEYDVDFIVVAADVTPILGSSTVQEMGLLEVHEDRILAVDSAKTTSSENILSEYPDVFTGTGKLEGEYHLEIDDNVKPVIHPPRRVPVALREKLKIELDRLTENEIIAPVDKPTQWVSSLVCVEKPNGSLRICLDPKDLNRGLQRSHHPMKIIEDILVDLKDAKVFSTFDAKNGFWHVELDEESSYLTTFKI
nr:uncharacterized protein LOC129277362 [Lytechinus pictus]